MPAAWTRRPSRSSTAGPNGCSTQRPSPTSSTSRGLRIMKIMRTAAARLRAEGRAEARAEGKAELLLHLLRKRFGLAADDHAHRLHSACIADLDRWADRLFDGATI